MRLWHQKLIPYLPRQQLLGQHRECCALRGAGWGRNHSVVNYVFEHDTEMLVAYHYLIIDEMQKRGYNPDKVWQKAAYRGKTLGVQEDWCDYRKAVALALTVSNIGCMIYPEHNDAYLQECLDNLKGKGICIDLN
jgi:uncharacterized protein (TIGR02328 family)